MKSIVQYTAPFFRQRRAYQILRTLEQLWWKAIPMDGSPVEGLQSFQDGYTFTLFGTRAHEAATILHKGVGGGTIRTLYTDRM